jgi:15-cis-phytoene synthase
MTSAARESRAIIAHHSKSFALASRLLPAAGRDHASIVYAWCRRADDAIDLVPASDQTAAVASLRRELGAIYAGEAQPNPILAAFQEVVRQRNIPREYPDELLSGMEMDAGGTAYGSYATLLPYCFRVAGTVGLMMSHVLGVRHPAALRNAAHLGIAMQLTNICRDVREDWERGRLYLPDDLLAGAGAPDLRAEVGRTALPRDARDSISRVILELLRRAEGFYRSADLGIPLLSSRSAWAVRTARLVYADIGRIIVGQQADVFAPRARVSTARKLVLAVRALALTPLPRAFEAAPIERSLGFGDVVPL